MATLKAIAQEVGVSIQTVSCVLNRGDIRFSEETKKRIHEVAKRLNYRVNHQARSLVGAKSGMLGMMKSLGFSYDHLEAIVLAGQAIHKFGYGVLSCDIPWYKNGLARAVDAMLDSHVEGV
ncbi:MAG: LacI family DNA-binding transcriptional regulator, partial [Chthoniobacterales bacterium]